MQISIHAPHEGERPLWVRGTWVCNLISIHAPHEGERLYRFYPSYCLTYFNPRSPRGGATARISKLEDKLNISIHAPHEGERRLRRHAETARSIFQSTLPTRGSDRISPCGQSPCRVFQSTLPTRGSDDFTLHVANIARLISIHAPHEGERRHK